MVLLPSITGNMSTSRMIRGSRQQALCVLVVGDRPRKREVNEGENPACNKLVGFHWERIMSGACSCRTDPWHPNHLRHQAIPPEFGMAKGSGIEAGCGRSCPH